MEIIANSANEAYVKILEGLRKDGILSKPRGLPIKEIINASICIKNPRARYIYDSDRNTSFAYAFGELCWYLRGVNDLESIRYYSKFYNRITDDGKTVNSAYGYRIYGHHPQIEFNQWERCKELLKNDPDSRQAIIHIHTPNNKPTKDEVCTLTLQFLIRNGKLHMITNMRSNDVVFGFTYDVFCFTALQELMAEELGVDLGYYYHNAASLHIYLNNFYGDKIGDLILKHSNKSSYGDVENYKKFFSGTAKLTNKVVKKIMQVEEYLRTTGKTDVLDKVKCNSEIFDFAAEKLLEHRYNKNNN